MNRIIIVIKNLFLNLSIFKKHNPVILGRWNIENCTKKINRKVDLSNEDHCGTCVIYKDK